MTKARYSPSVETAAVDPATGPIHKIIPPISSNLKLSVLIVDDHELVRAGMRRLLEDSEAIHSFAEASSGESALKAAATEVFDIILMDLSMPGMSGVEASLALLRHHPNARIVVITAALDDAHTRRLIKHGVKGYLTKDSSPAEMCRAISEVLRGQIYLAPAIAQKLAIEGVEDSGNTPFDSLTDREMQISMLLLSGKRNIEVGKSLFISEKTVSTHRTRAFDKLGVSNTAQLAKLAMQYGLWNTP